MGVVAFLILVGFATILIIPKSFWVIMILTLIYFSIWGPGFDDAEMQQIRERARSSTPTPPLSRPPPSHPGRTSPSQEELDFLAYKMIVEPTLKQNAPSDDTPPPAQADPPHPQPIQPVYPAPDITYSEGVDFF